MALKKRIRFVLCFFLSFKENQRDKGKKSWFFFPHLPSHVEDVWRNSNLSEWLHFQSFHSGVWVVRWLPKWGCPRPQRMTPASLLATLHQLCCAVQMPSLCCRMFPNRQMRWPSGPVVCSASDGPSSIWRSNSSRALSWISSFRQQSSHCCLKRDALGNKQRKMCITEMVVFNSLRACVCISMCSFVCVWGETPPTWASWTARTQRNPLRGSKTLWLSRTGISSGARKLLNLVACSPYGICALDCLDIKTQNSAETFLKAWWEANLDAGLIMFLFQLLIVCHLKNIKSNTWKN